jgi:hypothetical protein
VHFSQAASRSRPLGPPRLGLVMFMDANLIAALTWSVILSSRQQAKLTYASTLWSSMTRRSLARS